MLLFSHEASGFVLAGGATQRMGQDKALLPLSRDHSGAARRQYCPRRVGSAVLIGIQTLGHLGIPVFPINSQLRPAGGIYNNALQITKRTGISWWRATCGRIG